MPATFFFFLGRLICSSNNFVRYCILRVFQACEEQLLPGNILNLDEVIPVSLQHANRHRSFVVLRLYYIAMIHLRVLLPSGTAYLPP